MYRLHRCALASAGLSLSALGLLFGVIALGDTHWARVTYDSTDVGCLSKAGLLIHSPCLRAGSLRPVEGMLEGEGSVESALFLLM